MFGGSKRIGIENEMFIGADHFKSAEPFQQTVDLHWLQSSLQLAVYQRTNLNQKLGAYQYFMVARTPANLRSRYWCF